MTYKIGQIIKGKITGIQPYGAFVSLDEETQGLIHVSEVQSGYTKSIHTLLKVGQPVTVQIIDIDEYSKKLVCRYVRWRRRALLFLIEGKDTLRIKIKRSGLPRLRNNYQNGWTKTRRTRTERK